MARLLCLLALLLLLNTPIEREIAARETHSYTVNATAGQLLRLEISQHAIDLDSRVTDPSGAVVLEDSNADRRERLQLEWIASAAGPYQIDLTLRPTDRHESYRITLAEARPAQEADRRRIEAEQLSVEAYRLRAKGTIDSVKASVPAFEKAIAAWRAVGPPAQEDLARLLRALASVRRNLGAPQEAITLLNEAIALQANDPLQRALTLNEIGSARFIAGDSHGALESYEQALAGARAVHDRENETRTLNNMGTVLNNLGELHAALERYQQSLEAGEPEDRVQRASVISNLGVAYSNLGETPRAIEYLKQALDLRRELGDKRGQAQSLYVLGNVIQQTGEPQQALPYLNESLSLRRSTGDRPGEAFTLQTIGSCYFKLGELRVALDYFQQARQIRHDIGNRNDEADTLMHLSMAHGGLGQRPQAIDDGEEALRLMEQVKNQRGEGEALSSLGDLLLSFGEPQQALEHYERARPMLEPSHDAEAVMKTIGGLATAEIDLGKTREGADNARHAIEVAKQARNKAEQVEFEYQLARADVRLGELGAAREVLEEAVDTAETVRAHMVGAEFQAHYFATVRKAHDLLIDTLMRLDAKDAAFEVAERSRARSLLALLSESHADVRAGIDPELLDRERTLESALAAKTTYVMHASGRSPHDAELAQRELDALTTSFREVEAEIRVKSPAYAALTQPSTVTLDEVRHTLLDPDTLLLEYALGDERSYVWAITRDIVEVRELPARGAIETAVRRAYRYASTNDANDPAAEEASARSLRTLGDLLIGRKLAARAGIRRIAIVADGSLEYLPFAALQTGAGTPLLQHHEVVMLPSISTLAELRRVSGQRSPAAKTAAALADPVFDPHDPRVGSGETGGASVPTSSTTDDARRSAAEVGIDHLDRLTLSRQEADVIRSLLPASKRLTALDFDASRDTLLDPTLGDYRILHIATHGLVNSQHPELSGLVMSLVDRDGHARNGFVQAYELYKLKLSADLVVLSACQTALGEQIRGEGLISLTRPFMYAGAPRIVASLWQVPDRATAELMTLFYRAILRDHLSPAAALRHAQLTLQRTPRWSSPYFWAGFTLQGDWR